MIPWKSYFIYFNRGQNDLQVLFHHLGPPILQSNMLFLGALYFSFFQYTHIFLLSHLKISCWHYYTLSYWHIYAYLSVSTSACISKNKTFTFVTTVTLSHSKKMKNNFLISCNMLSIFKFSQLSSKMFSVLLKTIFSSWARMLVRSTYYI